MTAEFMPASLRSGRFVAIITEFTVICRQCRSHQRKTSVPGRWTRPDVPSQFWQSPNLVIKCARGGFCLILHVMDASFHVMRFWKYWLAMQACRDFLLP